MRVVLSEDLEKLKERVIGCAIDVHRVLGPGLLESVYRDCLVIELRAAGIALERERRVPLHYRGQPIGTGFRIDLLVGDRLIVEVKAVERLHPVHSAQVITYLKITGLPAALLLNFNVTSLRTGVKALFNPELLEPGLVAWRETWNDENR